MFDLKVLRIEMAENETFNENFQRLLSKL